MRTNLIRRSEEDQKDRISRRTIVVAVGSAVTAFLAGCADVAISKMDHVEDPAIRKEGNVMDRFQVRLGERAPVGSSIFVISPDGSLHANGFRYEDADFDRHFRDLDYGDVVDVFCAVRVEDEVNVSVATLAKGVNRIVARARTFLPEKYRLVICIETKR